MVVTPRFLRRGAVLLAALTVLAACSQQPSDPESPTAQPPASPSDSPTAMPDVPAELADYYEQDAEWEECGQFDCADIEVPLDYDDPDGERIDVAMKRRGASQESQGSLFVNPGGPGGSGLQLVDAVEMQFSEDLLDGYDVVGFDPRGVGSSTAVECLDDAELDEWRATELEEEGEELAEIREEAAWFGEQCEDNTGELLANVDTESAARDIDVMRHVLGEPELDYLGYSYGTLLGATYAELFPDNAGRLVLDGALDPSMTNAELSLDQAVAFEETIGNYVEDCQASGSCPLSGDVDDGVGQIQDLIELAEHTPLRTDSDRELTGSLLISGILMPLYDDEYWPVLTEALDAAMHEDDGSYLLMLADLAADREPDGSYTNNSAEAIVAINCLDYPSDSSDSELAEQAEELEELSPTFGEALTYGDVACQEWPHQAETKPAPIHAEGAGPILVVGTTGDPATPYEWSQNVTEQLDDAQLLTFEGEGHTAYGRSNDCVTTAVDDYLLDGTMPEEDLRC